MIGNLISNIKDAITIISIVVTLGLGYWGKVQQEEASRATNNLYSKTVEWKDEKGRLVTEVTELRYTTKELKDIAKLDSTKLSRAQKDLLQANNLVKELKLKERNVESVNIADLRVHNDSLVSTITYDKNNKLEALKPIKTEHLYIDFKVEGDTVLVDHKYNVNINTVVRRERDKVTKAGNPRFFIARWVNPRWQYSAINVADDDKAKIDSAIHINFQNKKGKR